MTTVSAASALASFAPGIYGQPAPIATGSAFAEEFEGCAALQDQRPSYGSETQDRGAVRHSSGTAKPQKDTKDNNVDQTAAMPVVAAAPTALPLVLHPDTQDDAGSPGDQADANLQPAAAAGPQPPSTVQGQLLAADDPQTTAFMMRMQVAAAADASAIQQGLTDAGVPAIKKLGDGETQELPSLTQSGLAAFEQSRQLEPVAEVKQVAALSQAPEVQSLQTEEPVRAPQPLNNILLQVNQSANEKVLVSLVQQSGELRLAVRTDDSELAQGLQQGLSDLVGKLQGTGYRADTWHPVQSQVAVAPTLESQNASNQSHPGGSQSQPGWSQQDGGQQRQNQSNRPRWVEEMESSLTGRGQTSGETHGFSS